MQLIGLARLGKDGELRTLPDGSKVMNLALAFNYGKKDQTGKRPTQWVEAAMFGDRAEKLAAYMVKGQQVMVHLAEPHIELYTSRDGTSGAKLTSFINNLEFAGPAPQSNGQAAPAPAQRQQAPAPQQRQQTQGQRQQANAMDWPDDDIPF